MRTNYWNMHSCLLRFPLNFKEILTPSEKEILLNVDLLYPLLKLWMYLNKTTTSPVQFEHIRAMHFELKFEIKF